MNSIDVSSLLAEMRALAAQAQSLDAAAGPAADVADSTPKVRFADLMSDSVNAVHEAQGEAKALAAAFEAGDENVDLAEVMISLQKASLSFQAMTEVRNKLVTAYQEIMNMPV
jgi:flagellar hook-basal body complex protein FliE